MRRRTVLGACCGIFCLAGAANADSISQAQLNDGSSVVTGLLADGSATATAYSNYSTGSLGVFSHFSVIGIEPVAGVKQITWLGGNALINGPEAIAFDFANPVVVSELDVAFLYKGLLFLPNEAALFKVTYADGSLGSFTLTPTSFTSASYSGPGATVTSEDLGLFGEWSIANPFGEGSAVTKVALLAGSWSDFGFESLSVSPAAVPLPAAIWSGMALVVAIGAAKLRRPMAVA